MGHSHSTEANGANQLSLYVKCANFINSPANLDFCSGLSLCVQQKTVISRDDSTSPRSKTSYIEKWLSCLLRVRRRQYCFRNTVDTSISALSVLWRWVASISTGQLPFRFLGDHWPCFLAERLLYRLSPQWYMLTPLLFCKLKGSSCIYTGHSS